MALASGSGSGRFTYMHLMRLQETREVSTWDSKIGTLPPKDFLGILVAKTG